MLLLKINRIQISKNMNFPSGINYYNQVINYKTINEKFNEGNITESLGAGTIGSLIILGNNITKQKENSPELLDKKKSRSTVTRKQTQEKNPTNLKNNLKKNTVIERENLYKKNTYIDKKNVNSKKDTKRSISCQSNNKEVLKNNLMFENSYKSKNNRENFDRSVSPLNLIEMSINSKNMDNILNTRKQNITPKEKKIKIKEKKIEEEKNVNINNNVIAGKNPWKRVSTQQNLIEKNNERGVKSAHEKIKERGTKNIEKNKSEKRISNSSKINKKINNEENYFEQSKRFSNNLKVVVNNNNDKNLIDEEIEERVEIDSPNKIFLQNDCKYKKSNFEEDSLENSFEQKANIRDFFSKKNDNNKNEVFENRKIISGSYYEKELEKALNNNFRPYSPPFVFENFENAMKSVESEKNFTKIKENIIEVIYDPVLKNYYNPENKVYYDLNSK